MAEQMQSWSFRTNERWEEKYNWADWMNGHPWKLVRGTEKERVAGMADFSITAESFQQTALNWARRHKKDGILKVRTEIVDDDTVVLQAQRGTIDLPARLKDLHDAVTDIGSVAENPEFTIAPALATSLRKEADAFRKLVTKMTR